MPRYQIQQTLADQTRNHSASLTTQTQNCLAIQKKNKCSLTRRDTVPQARRSNETRWWRDSSQRRRDPRGNHKLPSSRHGVRRTLKHRKSRRHGPGKKRDVLPLVAIAVRCTASLRTSANHLGLRGLIPLSPSRTLTALSMTSSLPTCLVGCPAIAGVRGTAVSAVLCRTCVLLPAAATRSRLGLVRPTCRPPE